MSYRYLSVTFVITSLLFIVSHSAFSQVKYIEVNINQPGLAECLATSVGETPESAMDVNIYPNPNEGDFIVEINHTRTMDHVVISISNMNGVQLHSEEIKGKALHFKKQLHLSHLSKGVYFLAVRFDQGKCIRRLIIL